MDEQKIIFSNRFEKEKFEDYKTDLGTGNTITPDFTEADDFFKFIQKNRRSVPSKERIADKDDKSGNTSKQCGQGYLSSNLKTDYQAEKDLGRPRPQSPRL